MGPLALALGKFHEVRYRFWCFLLKQADNDVSF
jgi:hypothetical protein